MGRRYTQGSIGSVHRVVHREGIYQGVQGGIPPRYTTWVYREVSSYVHSWVYTGYMPPMVLRVHTVYMPPVVLRVHYAQSGSCSP